MKKDRKADSGEKIGKWILNIQGKYQEANKDFFDNLDNMTLADAIAKYEKYSDMLWLIPSFVWLIEAIFFFVPLQSLSYQIFTLIISVSLMANLIGVNSINWFLMNLYTREPNTYKEDRLDKIQRLLKTRNHQRALTLGGIFNTIAIFTIIPYYEFLRNNPTLSGWSVQMTDKINGSDIFIKLIIVALPIFITVNLYQMRKRTVEQYRDQIAAGIEQKEYTNSKIRHMLNNESKEDRSASVHIPNMLIGKSVQTGEPVMQSVTTRRQNSIYFGAVGSGKSKTIFISQINQDLNKLIAYMRDFPKISKDPDFMKKPGNIATQYLSGLMLIDPTNDLNQDVYNLAKAKGIPDEMIMWIDPGNPHTPGINIMRGPADKVAEAVTNAIAGVKEGTKDFFHEAERAHLKNYVLLGKFVSVIEEVPFSFDELKKMYDNIYLTREKAKKLGAYLKVLEGKLAESDKIRKADPNNIVKLKDYQELLDKYNIVKSTHEWFRANIVADRRGNTVVKRSDPNLQQLDDKDPDKWQYLDAQAENVNGLRNTLDDIAKNIGLRRVLFRDSGDFTIDDALYRGKIILFNTDKEHIGASLSKTIGQIYLSIIEDAVLRRKPNAVPMFPLYMDEFAEYVDESFAKYIAQSRKFSSPSVIATQSPSQLSYTYGPEYFKTLVDNILTVGTFGNMSPDSAQLFERFFGTKQVASRSANEQQIDLMQGMDDNRRMVTTRMEEVPNITADELMALDKYTVAVRTPNPRGFRGSMLFNTIRTDYVDEKTEAGNPNNFNINDPKDKKGLEAVINAPGIENPDFDFVDSEIHAEYESGTFHYEFTQTGAKVLFDNGHSAKETENAINSKIGGSQFGTKKSDISGNPAKSNGFNNAKENQSADVQKDLKADDNISTLSSSDSLVGSLFTNGEVQSSKENQSADVQKKPADNSATSEQITKEDNGSNDEMTADDLFKSMDTPAESGGDDLFGNSNNKASNDFLNNLQAKAEEKSTDQDQENFVTPEPQQVITANPLHVSKRIEEAADPNGKHGGNNRFKHDLNTEEKPIRESTKAAVAIQPINSQTGSKSMNTTKVEAQSTTPVKQDIQDFFMPNKVSDVAPIQSKSSNDKESDNMFKIDPRTGALKEDNKNRKQMEERYIAKQKRQNVNDAVDSLVAEAENEVNSLSSRSNMTPKQKLAALATLKQKYQEQISSIDPLGMPEDLETIFASEKQKFFDSQKQEENQGIVFGGKNTQQNMNNLKDNADLLNSIKDMMNQTEDPNIEVDLNHNKIIRDAVRDNDFNDNDPFYNQPGMKDGL